MNSDAVTRPRWWTPASPPPRARQARTVSASPGRTGEANRASMCWKLAASDRHRVQQGPAGEAVAAQSVQDRAVEATGGGEGGSECSGLRSPLRRYSRAWSGDVRYVTSWSGAPSGRHVLGPDGPGRRPSRPRRG